jgi:hypothetical protein
MACPAPQEGLTVSLPEMLRSPEPGIVVSDRRWPPALMQSARIPVLIIRSVSANAGSWLEQILGKGGIQLKAAKTRYPQVDDASRPPSPSGLFLPGSLT